MIVTRVWDNFLRKEEVAQLPDGVIFTIRKNEADTDTLEVEEKQTADRRLYKSFRLFGEVDNNPVNIGFLFQRELNPLIVAFGEDSTKWDGCQIKVKAVPVKATLGVTLPRLKWHFEEYQPPVEVEQI